jgi:hypothetical protein
MPVLPLAQLGYLFVRTIAKPVATAIKNRMKHHPKFKKGCVSMAQAYHRWERKMKVNMMGIQVANVQPLSEEKAIELGANMLSESILFTIAGTMIYVDFTRRSIKEKEKEASRTEMLIELQQELGRIQHYLYSIAQEHQALRHKMEEHFKLKSWNFFPKKKKDKTNETMSVRTLPTDQTIETILSDRNVAVTSRMLQHSITNTVSAEEKLRSMAEALKSGMDATTEKDRVNPVEKEKVLDESRTVSKPKPWYYRSFKWLISTIDDVLDDLNIKEDDTNMTVDINIDESDTAGIADNS